MTPHEKIRASLQATMLRIACPVLAAWAVLFGSSDSAEAGIILDCGMSPTYEASDSLSPLLPRLDFLLLRQRQQASHVLSSPGETAGAGTQSPTSGLSIGLVGSISDVMPSGQASLTSWLTLSSRAALPDPLEDRFFRPPRTNIV